MPDWVATKTRFAKGLARSSFFRSAKIQSMALRWLRTSQSSTPWTGETDRALETLSYLAGIPATMSYGHLSLHPEWDPLRNDPRFAKIIASLAPKN